MTEGNTGDPNTEGYPSSQTGEVLREFARGPRHQSLQWGSAQNVPGGAPFTLCRVDLARLGIAPQSLHIHVDTAANSIVQVQYGSGGARHVLNLPANTVFRNVVCGDFVEVVVTPNGVAPVWCVASVALAYCATVP